MSILRHGKAAMWYSARLLNLSSKVSMSPRSPTLSPFLLILLAYAGPIPFLVVPILLRPSFVSWFPSTVW